MPTPPLRTELADTYPNPSNAVMRAGMGKFWDYVTTLLGATGTAADARTALGAGDVTKTSVQTQSVTAFTSAGTSPNFTLTPTPVIAAYGANQRFRVKFHTAGTTGSNTLNISGLGPKNIKQYDSTGAKVSGVVTSGFLADVEYDGTHLVILNPLPSSQTAITATSDPTFSDNSSSPAATNWVRGAMLAIATAAGFVISLTEKGYIKFPSWLGGLIIQWMNATESTSASDIKAWPITFPNNLFNAQACRYPIANSAEATTITATASGVVLQSGAFGGGTTYYVLGIGN